jgi:hypothetical protein
MIWQNILLVNQLDNEVLKEALTAAFDLKPHDVTVVDSIEKAEHRERVVVEKTSTKGDFRCLLSLFVVEELLGRDPLEITRRFCSKLKIIALIPDESLNPYSMILVDRIGGTRAVFLDVESLDQREEYRLSNEVLGDD